MSDNPLDLRMLRLLVVEDEAMVAMLIEDALTLHGHTVVGVAGSIADALAIAERERPDMALCDVRLADGDSGVAVAEALAERGIPSLFLSGNCPLTARHRLIVGCVPKPFHTGSLGRTVAAAHASVMGEPPAALPAKLMLYAA